MKITDIKVIIASPGRNFVTVKVYTDQGLTGIGDAQDAAQWFQSDRIHPNAKAQPQMLGNVWPKLSSMLK